MPRTSKQNAALHQKALIARPLRPTCISVSLFVFRETFISSGINREPEAAAARVRVMRRCALPSLDVAGNLPFEIT